MPMHEVEPLLVAAAWTGIAGCFPARQLREEPRIEQRAAADGESGATRLTEHARCIVERAHVAVANDRDALDGFHHGPDAGEVNRPAKTLFARPAVDRQSRDPDLLESASEVRGAPILFVPAKPHL